jgi:hypothetical protein
LSVRAARANAPSNVASRKLTTDRQLEVTGVVEREVAPPRQLERQTNIQINVDHDRSLSKHLLEPMDFMRDDALPALRQKAVHYAFQKAR